MLNKIKHHGESIVLHLLLKEFKIDVLDLIEKKISKQAGSLYTSEESRQALPEFYELFLNYLIKSSQYTTKEKIHAGATDYGRELLRLGYSLSHVVNAYSAVFQSLSEIATAKNYNITPAEFAKLNMCLDTAIAAAVTEHQYQSTCLSDKKEIEHLGILAHELRNALSNATIAHGMIKNGLVGTKGSTSQILDKSLVRMQYLIDSTLSEVRMRTNPELILEEFELKILVDQIILTAHTSYKEIEITLLNLVEKNIKMHTDRQLLLSAVANLIQNAIKYSAAGGKVTVLNKLSQDNVIIEVQDTCGGISKDKLNNLIKPFDFGSKDHSGLGLGLVIVHRAVTLLQGSLSVKSTEGVGCRFKIDIPRALNAD